MGEIRHTPSFTTQIAIVTIMITVIFEKLRIIITMVLITIEMIIIFIASPLFLTYIRKHTPSHTQG
jgi:hypothetical protein